MPDSRWNPPRPNLKAQDKTPVTKAPKTTKIKISRKPVLWSDLIANPWHQYRHAQVSQPPLPPVPKPVEVKPASPEQLQVFIDKLANPNETQWQSVFGAESTVWEKADAPILDPIGYIEHQVQEEINAYEAKTKENSPLTPHTMIEVKYQRKLPRNTNMAVMQIPPITVRYSLMDVAMRRYAEPLESTTFEVLSEGSDEAERDIIGGLRKFSFQSKMEHALVEYRNDDGKVLALRNITVAAVASSVLTYLARHPQPTGMTRAAQAFLQGNLQATTVYFRDVPLNGVIWLPVGRVGGLLIDIDDQQFFELPSVRNKYGNGKTQEVIKLPNSEAFRKLIYRKLPFKESAQAQAGKRSFSHAVVPDYEISTRGAPLSLLPYHGMLYDSPLTFGDPASSPAELSRQLVNDLLVRIESDIDWLIYSDTEASHNNMLSITKMLTTVADIGLSIYSFGTHTLIRRLLIYGAMGVTTLVNVASSGAQAYIADDADRRQAYLDEMTAAAVMGGFGWLSDAALGTRAIMKALYSPANIHKAIGIFNRLRSMAWHMRQRFLIARNWDQLKELATRSSRLGALALDSGPARQLATRIGQDQVKEMVGKALEKIGSRVLQASLESALQVLESGINKVLRLFTQFEALESALKPLLPHVVRVDFNLLDTAGNPLDLDAAHAGARWALTGTSAGSTESINLLARELAAFESQNLRSFNTLTRLHELVRRELLHDPGVVFASDAERDLFKNVLASSLMRDPAHQGDVLFGTVMRIQPFANGNDLTARIFYALGRLKHDSSTFKALSASSQQSLAGIEIEPQPLPAPAPEPAPSVLGVELPPLLQDSIKMRSQVKLTYPHDDFADLTDARLAAIWSKPKGPLDIRAHTELQSDLAAVGLADLSASDRMPYDQAVAWLREQEEKLQIGRGLGSQGKVGVLLDFNNKLHVLSGLPATTKSMRRVLAEWLIEADVIKQRLNLSGEFDQMVQPFIDKLKVDGALRQITHAGDRTPSERSFSAVARVEELLLEEGVFTSSTTQLPSAQQTRSYEIIKLLVYKGKGQSKSGNAPVAHYAVALRDTMAEEGVIVHVLDPTLGQLNAQMGPFYGPLDIWLQQVVIANRNNIVKAQTFGSTFALDQAHSQPLFGTPGVLVYTRGKGAVEFSLAEQADWFLNSEAWDKLGEFLTLPSTSAGPTVNLISHATLAQLFQAKSYAQSTSALGIRSATALETRFRAVASNAQDMPSVQKLIERIRKEQDNWVATQALGLMHLVTLDELASNVLGLLHQRRVDALLNPAMERELVLLWLELRVQQARLAGLGVGEALTMESDVLKRIGDWADDIKIPMAPSVPTPDILLAQARKQMRRATGPAPADQADQTKATMAVDLAGNLLEQSGCLDHGAAASFKTSAKGFAKAPTAEASSQLDTLRETLIPGGKQIQKKSDLIELAPGQVLLIVTSQGQLRHVMVSLGRGRFAGAGPALLDVKLSEEPSIFAAEELGGEFEAGALTPFGVANSPVLHAYAGYPPQAKPLAVPDAADPTTTARAPDLLGKDAVFAVQSLPAQNTVTIRAHGGPATLNHMLPDETYHMVRALLLKHAPGAGSTFSFRTMDPTKTMVELVVCYGAAGGPYSVGQRLANALGVKVRATNRFIDMHDRLANQGTWYTNEFVPGTSYGNLDKVLGQLEVSIKRALALGRRAVASVRRPVEGGNQPDTGPAQQSVVGGSALRNRRKRTAAASNDAAWLGGNALLTVLAEMALEPSTIHETGRVLGLPSSEIAAIAAAIARQPADPSLSEVELAKLRCLWALDASAKLRTLFDALVRDADGVTAPTEKPTSTTTSQP